MKKKTFLLDAVTVSAGGLIAKILGALYRIPMLALIGGYGMGLYQTVFPLYTLLLSLSGAGITATVSKLVAETRAKGNAVNGVFFGAKKLFFPVGLIGSAVMLLLSVFFVRYENNPVGITGYLFLAPSVFLTCGVYLYRGYLQGLGDMSSTAISEILEQLFKLSVALPIAYFLRGKVERTVQFILLSVSVSEGLTLLFLAIRKRRFGEKGNALPIPKKTVLSLAVPLSLSSVVLPLCVTVESTVLVALLSKTHADAVSLYGLFSGGAVTLVNLPVSVAYGIATACVPTVSVAKQNDPLSVERKITQALLLTFSVGLLSAVGLYIFSPIAVKILYSGLQPSEKITLIRLTKLSSVSALFLPCHQTLSACLTGLGKPKKPLLFLVVGTLVRLIFDFVLVQNTNLGIDGLAISMSLGYFVAFSLNLVYNLSINFRRKENDYGRRFRSKRRRFNEVG